MHRLLASMLLLEACAPAAVHPDRGTRFFRAIDRQVADARRELLATGECTRRGSNRCRKGFSVWWSNGFVGSVEYFDPAGHSIGTDDFSCLADETKGEVLRKCDEDEELLCPRALAQLQRVEATIHFAGKDVRITQDTEFEGTQFRGTVGFAADPLQPLTLTVTAIEPDVEPSTFIMLEQPPRLGETIVIPSAAQVRGSRTLSVTSRYAPRSAP